MKFDNNVASGEATAFDIYTQIMVCKTYYLVSIYYEISE